MFGKSIGVLALTAAVVLALPDTSQAQIFRWGRGWRGDGGWYDGQSSFYYTSGYPYGVSYSYDRGYYPYAYSYGYYPAWYNRFGYRSTYYGSPSFYTRQMPGYYAYQSAYPSPEVVNRMPDPGLSVLAAVRVPTPDTQLWIEGKEMTSGGILRTFISPPLESGKDYTYTIRASWTENGKAVDRTQVVDVKAGKRVAVDFTEGQQRRQKRQSGYGPEGRQMPSPARPGTELRPGDKTRANPPAPGSDQFKPKQNGQDDRPQALPNDKPQNPDREDK